MKPNLRKRTHFYTRNVTQNQTDILKLSLKLPVFQVSGKRFEGKEADHLDGGEYEAAVNQEKEDDRRSHEDLVGGTGTLPQEMGCGPEEVSVVALNVRT